MGSNPHSHPPVPTRAGLERRTDGDHAAEAIRLPCFVCHMKQCGVHQACCDARAHRAAFIMYCRFVRAILDLHWVWVARECSLFFQILLLFLAKVSLVQTHVFRRFLPKLPVKRILLGGAQHAEEVRLAAYQGASIRPVQLARRGRAAAIRAELAHARRETAAGLHGAA